MTEKDKKPSAPAPEPIEDIGLGAADESAELEAAAALKETDERAETPALTAAEIKKIKEQARREVEAEFKKKLREKALAEEKAKARQALSMSENTHLAGPLSDMVRITIDIPEFSNTPWIQIGMPEGKCYLHGSTYTVPRHVGNSLRESMQNMRRHQNEIDGKKRNRQLPDGRFVDVVTGRVTTQTGVTVGKQEAA